MVTLLIHYRCGGTLHPESHDYWTIGFHKTGRAPHINGLEQLHRCDRCNLIGVATEPPR